MDVPDVDTSSRSTYLVPFVIALVALGISVATSVWSVSESRAARGNSDDTASLVKSAMGDVSGSGIISSRKPETVVKPGMKLRTASAFVSASGTVTKSSGEKPKVKATGIDALNDALGPVLAAQLGDIAGLWCLSGGPWSIKDVGVKATGNGKVLTDSTHEACSNGVFVASFDQQSANPQPFSITIYWVSKN